MTSPHNSPPPLTTPHQVLGTPSAVKTDTETREWFTGIMILLSVTVITALLSSLQARTATSCHVTVAHTLTLLSSHSPCRNTL